MAKYFNAEGICIPEEHYMVPLDSRLDEIKILVEQGKYFTMNRARQYGKTTTLQMLHDSLEENYHVFLISLEGMGEGAYVDAASFCRYFCGLLYDTIDYGETKGISKVLAEKLRYFSDTEKQDFRDLGNFISRLCRESEKPVVLMIDEVDQASEYDVFLKFLGMLRDKYLKRQNRPSFQSVILAGVYDIKNLKRHVRMETEQVYNSPWNIAADFLVDMAFSESDIMKMLEEYQADHEEMQNTAMDCRKTARLLYDYTSGYPYLVSRICKLVDERIMYSGKYAVDAWGQEGVLAAIKMLVKEPCTLFDDIRKKLDDYPKLQKMISELLFNGVQIPYHSYNRVLDIGLMFGFLKEKNETAAVANRIFEIFFYNLFLSEQALESETYKSSELCRQQFIKEDGLDITNILQKFTEHFTEVYDNSSQQFVEENGRRLFLLYLKPIINGIGNYYIEAQTRNRLRTDVIIDYSGKQYVIEIKIWHGNAYHERGEKQLAEYLDAYHLNEGYMLSFNFNKKKVPGIKKIQLGDKLLVEAVV